MSRCLRTFFLLMGVAAGFAISSLAQPAGNVVAPKSPVALFRELLAMSPAERAQALAVRPAFVRERILDKLSEYQILPLELRELRLEETELRWYLRPLMDEPRANRAARLALIPEPQRKLVEDRLQLWDVLPPPLQEQFKNNDTIASYFSQIESASAEQRAAILATIPPARQAELKKGLDRWAGLSEDERQKALAGFNTYFQLTPEEKEKTLDTLSDADRQRMEQTLSAYGNLTLAQRAECIRSFKKFAGMSVVERQQFLKNAELWRKMTPEEQQKWRELVSVAPIMPPTLDPNQRSIPMRSQLPGTHAFATN